VTVFDALDDGGHEQVVWCRDERSGLRAIIAVHSTVLGPALGGTRMRTYASDGDALHDVLRLARGMTYKAALAGIDLGGGKAVILGDPPPGQREPRLRAYGRFVDSLGGRYITAEDVGTTQADMDLVREETRYVTGVSTALGGSGDPSPLTALGVVHAMSAVAGARWGEPDLGARHVMVVGVGKVGSALVGELVARGARVSVADVDVDRVRAAVDRYGARPVPVGDALGEPCDILAPCALGGVLDASTIARLSCAAVCGSANNQLAEPEDAERLADAGVLYVPDYVASAGGIINIVGELQPGGYDRDRAVEAVRAVGTTTTRVLALAEEDGITPVAAANRLAEARLAAASGRQSSSGAPSSSAVTRGW
jgi:glutamate dehydrogenase/leucine dehydrogenase